MISIIVSSHNEQYFVSFSQNVAKTIGTEYEIIQIHNPGTMGICEAYNIGISQARFPILCFSHEDIEIKTQHWGLKLTALFEQDSKLGIVGIAGSSYKTWAPAGWWAFNPAKKFIYMNALQADIKKNEPAVLEVVNPNNTHLQEVKVVDGCWFCTTKAIAQKLKFDQHTFKDYHCYDLDFSLTVADAGYKVMVTYEILMEHFSRGSFTKNWVIETFKLHHKWKAKLPASSEFYTKSESRYEEALSLRFLLQKCLQHSIPIKKILSIQYSKEYFTLIGLKYWILNNAWILRELTIKRHRNL